MNHFVSSSEAPKEVKKLEAQPVGMPGAVGQALAPTKLTHAGQRGKALVNSVGLIGRVDAPSSKPRG